MGFVQRAFTPPGSGDMSAVVAQQAAAYQASEAAKAAQTAAAKPPSIPTTGAPPAPPPQFAAGSAPGAKQRAQITATSMLGAAATGGQTAKKTLLGG
jgi:hypothetical protein